MTTTAAFTLGQTVRIAPGSYYGAVRPEYATITGEGARADTYRVVHGGWGMTYHASELTDVTGQGHGAQAAGYYVVPTDVAIESEFWATHYAVDAVFTVTTTSA